jgi:hypothetical protein
MNKKQPITSGIKQSGFSAILWLCFPFELRWWLTIHLSQSASISYRQPLVAIKIHANILLFALNTNITKSEIRFKF